MDMVMSADRHIEPCHLRTELREAASIYQWGNRQSSNVPRIQRVVDCPSVAIVSIAKRLVVLETNPVRLSHSLAGIWYQGAANDGFTSIALMRAHIPLCSDAIQLRLSSHARLHKTMRHRRRNRLKKKMLKTRVTMLHLVVASNSNDGRCATYRDEAKLCRGHEQRMGRAGKFA